MKQQYILLSLGAALICGLFFFGRTSEPVTPKPAPAQSASGKANIPVFDINQHINIASKQLTASQLTYITEVNNAVTRGNVPAQQAQAYATLANFWKDSARDENAYIYYLSEASKLDNSQKSLTFAARLILDNMRAEHDEAKSDWKANTAISLFEKLVQLDSTNTDAKVGIGACYIYGKGRNGNAGETMKGVQLLRDVVAKDSNNLQAQLVLGVGGFYSRQYDKAIPRLLKVATAQPSNFEAVVTLADSYANMAENANAIRWYNQAKKINTDPLFIKEVDERIKELSQ